MEINRGMTPSRFVEVFGPALQEYLENTYGKDGAYVLDLLPQSAEFFSVSYHTIAALEYAEYTSSTGDVPPKKKRKN
jgi:hypothetical protein